VPLAEDRCLPVFRLSGDETGSAETGGPADRAARQPLDEDRQPFNKATRFAERVRLRRWHQDFGNRCGSTKFVRNRALASDLLTTKPVGVRCGGRRVCRRLPRLAGEAGSPIVVTSIASYSSWVPTHSPPWHEGRPVAHEAALILDFISPSADEALMKTPRFLGPLLHFPALCGSRASARFANSLTPADRCQGEGREFKSLFPLQNEVKKPR
jgi:hypothetical protein